MREDGQGQVLGGGFNLGKLPGVGGGGERKGEREGERISALPAKGLSSSYPRLYPEILVPSFQPPFFFLQAHFLAPAFIFLSLASQYVFSGRI